MYVPGLSKLCVDALHDVRRNGEADPFATARLRQDERVDADKIAFGVEERASAVPWVDRGVGLDVDHRIVSLELPRCRADNAHADRIVKAERAADHQGKLSFANF